MYVCSVALISILLALQPTFVHTVSFFRNGDNREYMLSKKLLIPQQGVLKPYPPLQSVPLTPDGHLTSQAVKAETSPLLHTQSLLHRPTPILR